MRLPAILIVLLFSWPISVAHGESSDSVRRATAQVPAISPTSTSALRPNVRPNVLESGIWTVALKIRTDGAQYCEATAFGRRGNDAYAILMRMDGANPAFVVLHTGADFPDAKEALLEVDDHSPFVLPIAAQAPFGSQRAVAIDVAEPRYSREVLPQLYDSGAKTMKVRINNSQFAIPIFGFQAVTAAFTSCDERLRDQPQSAAANSPSPLDQLENILAQQRQGMRAIADFDLSRVASGQAVRRLKEMAASINNANGAFPATPDDNASHLAYQIGARDGVAAALASIRKSEEVEIGQMNAIIRDPSRLKKDIAALHLLKVRQFKDIEASLLRDILKSIVANPNLDARGIRKLAAKALVDDGQTLGASDAKSENAPVVDRQASLAHADPAAETLPLRHGIFSSASGDCDENPSNYFDMVSYDGAGLNSSDTSRPIKASTPFGLGRYDLSMIAEGNGVRENHTPAHAIKWFVKILDAEAFIVDSENPAENHTGYFRFCRPFPPSTPTPLSAEATQAPSGVSKPTVSPAKLVFSNDTYNGFPGIVYMHNGSRMVMFPHADVIVYDMPKASLAGIVRHGDVMFRGRITGAGATGLAYVFKAGCAPAPYFVVSDPDPTGNRLVLRGAAPIRDKTSCAVVGSSINSPNAALVLQANQEFGD